MQRSLVGALVLAALPVPAAAQSREALVIFKDGFTVKGRLVQKRGVVTDPVSGQSFSIPANGTFMHLDDDVRHIHFSPHHVQEAIAAKDGESRRDLMRIVKQKPHVRTSVILPNWVFEKIGEWNDRWERTILINTQRGHVEMRQRIILLTPWHTYIMSMEYNWDPQFQTKELGPDFVLKLLNEHYAGEMELKDYEKGVQIARFMQQAGWYGHALAELERVEKAYPEAKQSVEPLLKHLRDLRVSSLVDDIERTHRIGQHEEAQARIDGFFREGLLAKAGERHKIAVQELKNKYDAGNDKIAKAQALLKSMPARLPAAEQPFWGVVAATILEELTFDTVPRLDTFVTFAEQHQRELDNQRKPGQTTEEILALAATGWLQGNTLAEPDVKNAKRLFHARLLLREYLKTDGKLDRTNLLDKFSKQHEISPDMMARLIRLMPPIMAPEESPGREPTQFEIQAPDSSGGSYLVLTPPDYSPYRPHPVLVALHTSREKPDAMMSRMRELAAHHGYVLVAPQWGKGLRPSYGHSTREHVLVLDTIRDLRRRFNVDSDRVFLFGWEDGGTMAFDIGLAHPGQFAGVAPMNGSCAKFAEKCWTNAQYLPFYVIEGDFNGGNIVDTRKITKDWVRSHFPVLYVEYKGRASEWYGEELLNMMEWMNKKKRHHPAREVGKYHTAGGVGEEFRTLRDTGNKFYWLGTDDVDPRHVNDISNWQKFTRPATLQANINIGNEGSSQARIWNQINVRTTGVKSINIWLAPNMIDFTKPVLVRVNGNQAGPAKMYPPSLSTLLEEFYYSGDRQQVYYNKIELRGS